MSYHLLTPGPVELPREVREAGAKPLINHRSPAFSALFASVEEKLQRLLHVHTPAAILPSSGTGALECLAANFCGRGVKVLSVSCGTFGRRFRQIAELYGADVIPLDVPEGRAASPEMIAKSLAENPGCSVLMLTQNETSTGVMNPIGAICAALPAENRPLVLVDGVSAVGAMPSYPEEWGVDGLATASQKGLLTAPGLGLVWVSERAKALLETRACPSYILDLKRHLSRLKPGSSYDNPYTPPVSLYYQLEAALEIILRDGEESWFSARRRTARAFAAGLEALGFELFVKDPAARSAGVTAFTLPGLADIEPVRRALRAMDVEAAGGQDQYKGKMIRAAHYGEWTWPELCLVLGGLYGAMKGQARGDWAAAAWAAWEE